MDALDASIRRIRPLNGAREKRLGADVRALWESLTRERDRRKSAYLSGPAALSAYLRYFLPWNVYRYLRLLPSLDFSFLFTKEKPSLTDFGSGPLAFPIALWLACPPLRSKPLTIRAVDRVPASVEAGIEILADLCLSLTGSLPAWKLIRINDAADARVRGQSDLVSAAYFLNELDQRRSPSLSEKAAHSKRILVSGLAPGGRIIVIDSGDTRAASLLSALREEFMSDGLSILSPCPHREPCPMPGYFRQERSAGADSEGEDLIRGSDGKALALARAKRPWCHFAFGTEGAPKELVRLSERAGLPKERASFSFLFAEAPSEASDGAAKEPGGGALRVVSEAMPDPGGGTMNYACSRKGYALIRNPSKEAFAPGDLLSGAAESKERDPKTKAIVFTLPGTDRPPLSSIDRSSSPDDRRPSARRDSARQDGARQDGARRDGARRNGARPSARPPSKKKDRGPARPRRPGKGQP
jgi:hypothetical protein